MDKKLADERANYTQLLKQLEDQIDELVGTLNMPQLRKELETFTRKAMDEKSQIISNQLMLYLQKLLTQKNLNLKAAKIELPIASV